ncbi:MAG: DUF924 family protein [Candidatus Phaeomarinobacter sp.]
MSDVTAKDVVSFWLAAGEDKWFSKDDAFDAEIKARFGEAVIAAADGRYDNWAATAEGALALIILLDQFPRNLHRGSADAFAYDAQALAVTRKAIEDGHDMAIQAEDRSWFYMPFMHSEELVDQERCISLVSERLVDAEETLKFAIVHRDLIARFGRFPHRNALFGRTSTAEEENYLSSDGAFSG